MVYYRVAGKRVSVKTGRLKASKQHRTKIGEYPELPLRDARAQALSMRKLAATGVDPCKAPEPELTIADHYKRYLDQDVRPHVHTWKHVESTFRLHILPLWGDLKLAELSRGEVFQQLQSWVAEKKIGPARNSRKHLIRFYNWALNAELVDHNPLVGLTVRGLGRNRDIGSVLTDTQLRAIWLASEEMGYPYGTLTQLLMLTGARRSEALQAAWDQFDLQAGVWTKPSSHTKQRKEHRIPLSAPALALLRAVRSRSRGAYVFCRNGEDKPLTDVKRSWLSVCRAAGLAERGPKTRRDGSIVLGADGRPIDIWRPTVRLHDLRHTYASVLASAGLSLPIIGALLGHTQTQTTARYAHLLDDPLRAATEKAAEALTGWRADTTSATPAHGS